VGNLSNCHPAAGDACVGGSIWEATVTREKAQALKPQMKTISSHVFDGQMRLRVISQGERPSEEFTPATPTLEDYYFNLVSRSTWTACKTACTHDPV